MTYIGSSSRLNAVVGVTEIIPLTIGLETEYSNKIFKSNLILKKESTGLLYITDGVTQLSALPSVTDEVANYLNQHIADNTIHITPELTEQLNNATVNSLVLMDEIGRGTSTYEGSALALSIAQYLCSKVNCFTLFSTHYPEIASLADSYPNVKNICFKATEFDGSIVFLYKANEWSQNYSYAIEVGKLAGLPGEIIAYAKQIIENKQQRKTRDNQSLDTYEKTSGSVSQGNVTVKEKIIYKDPEVLEDLRKADLNSLSPIAALNLLFELKSKLS